MTFIDTNVFVYYVDVRDQTKRLAAKLIIEAAIKNPNYLISLQVLNEFANVALKKLAMDETDVQTYLEEFANIPISETHLSLSFKALEIRKRYGIQFYDSLLIAAAEENGCNEILSEDLTDGQVYCGVKVTNPFK